MIFANPVRRMIASAPLGALADRLGPHAVVIAVSLLVVAWGAPGWYLLAALFTFAVLPAAAATRWAIHTRQGVRQ